MNYKQTLDYLFNALPMFQRVGKAAYKANLDTTLALDAYFNHPHLHYKSIHVAGTNGKGSVSHILASVLQTCGYKTGLYTSPHLFDFRERIRINGKPVSKKKVMEFTKAHKPVFETLKPSFFEMTSAMALEIFRQEKVDVAVIETGMGGRLDSTNIITPELSIITNIGLDHMQFLGSTLKSIAAEKAGIIKPQIPVIIGESHEETQAVFMDKAAEMESPIMFSDKHEPAESIEQELHWQKIKVGSEVYKTDLTGLYQVKNLRTALAAINALKQTFPCSTKNLLKAVSSVKKISGLRGRWDVVKERPLTICETGHNEAGFKEIGQQLLHLNAKRLHIIIGMVNDKNPETVFPYLPKNAIFYFTEADIERAMPSETLRQKALDFELKGNAYPVVENAIRAAEQNAGSDDTILIIGSIFVVADALKYYDCAS